ncbi:hypothetical protein [Streptosporangium sp. KLBMP 9127]|nr:hypothetical protein [Streptosporangium sp. KLBMP 9127]
MRNRHAGRRGVRPLRRGAGGVEGQANEAAVLRARVVAVVTAGITRQCLNLGLPDGITVEQAEVLPVVTPRGRTRG